MKSPSVGLIPAGMRKWVIQFRDGGESRRPSGMTLSIMTFEGAI